MPRSQQEELRVLRLVGSRWRSGAGESLARSRALPIDPELTRFAEEPGPGRFARFAQVSMFRPQQGDELEATAEASEPESLFGRLMAGLRGVVVGPPLRSSAVVHERMRKLVALPVLASDLLSSVAYGPEAMLAVLALAGSGRLGLSLPLAGGLVVLMVTVGLSYRQTIAAYPSGAGSYIVAGDNLGELPGLAAAAGLLTDYVLTVAVSIAAGIAAIVSALPALHGSTVELGLGVIALLLAGNLRGVRQAGVLFAAPTYVFLLAMFVLLAVGFAHAAGDGFAAAHPPPVKTTQALSLLLLLRAFASGATSMTGIEAVSNAVPAFQPEEPRNARATLGWMIGLLVTLFAALILLIHLNGLVPRPNETVLSQLARRSFGGGVLYGYVQAATALILLFAANTAFNGFPRLLSFMAENGHVPRRFLRQGDRLVYSNGIFALALAAAALFAGFRGKTEALIPLYAVGVFLAFTLSQTGMVVHWWRNREQHWRKSILLNGIGALLSGIVLVIAAVGKFAAGAWVVVVAIPLVVWLALRIGGHYETVDAAVALRPPGDTEAAAASTGSPDKQEQTDAANAERQQTPQQIPHLIIVPIARLDAAALSALAYAASLAQPTLAVHISPDQQDADDFEHAWQAFGAPLRLEVVISPYRALAAPLAHYIEALHTQQPNLTTTVVLPELIVKRAWQRLLHSGIASRLRDTLRAHPGIVITSVPFHLPE